MGVSSKLGGDSMTKRKFTSAKPFAQDQQTLDADGVSVKIFNPENCKPYGVGIMFFHGSDWVTGSVEESAEDVQKLADSTRVKVISVEYRKPPEHIYPAALNDCVKATQYFLKEGKTYGIEPTRMALAGEGCGGTLALAVSLKLRDTNFKPMPRLLLLMHPHLQIFDFSLPSYHLTPDRGHKKNIIISWLMYGFGKKDFYSDFMNNTHVTLEARQTYNKLVDFGYLDECFYVEGYTRPEPSPGNEDVWNSIKKLVLDPYFAPGMAENLQGIPKTFIVTLANSPVRDEAVIFHWRMATYGDPNTIFRHPIYDDVKYGDVFKHTVVAYMSDGTREVLLDSDDED